MIERGDPSTRAARDGPGTRAARGRPKHKSGAGRPRHAGTRGRRSAGDAGRLGAPAPGLAARGSGAGQGCYNGAVEARWQRSRVRAEIWIVLGLSIGQSAVYAVVNIVARLTAETPLGRQSATLNASRSERPYLDLVYQLLSIGFKILPVALALYLLSKPGRRAVHRVGLDLVRPVRDMGVGVALAALIGIPGLGLYALGRALGITVEIRAAALDTHWWVVPVLILSALANGLLEEVVAVGYVVERLEELGRRPMTIVLTSSVLRGSYHLYQGIGPFFANLAMGLVFAEYYRRRRRTMPLVVAHTLLDVVAFVGYALLPATVLARLGVS